MNFTVSLALVDFIPVILYIISMVIVAGAMKAYMPGPLNILLRFSTISIFATGILKAASKLLLAMDHGSEKLSSFLDTYYFPSLVTLYLLAGISVIISLMIRSPKKAINITAVPIGLLLTAVLGKTLISFADTDKNKMLFVGILMFGNLIFWGSLAFLSFKNKISAAGVLFILTFIFLMYMGYLNTKDFTDTKTHWIAESVNIAAQTIMLIASAIFGKKIKKAYYR